MARENLESQTTRLIGGVIIGIYGALMVIYFAIPTNDPEVKHLNQQAVIDATQDDLWDNGIKCLSMGNPRELCNSEFFDKMNKGK